MIGKLRDRKSADLLASKNALKVFQGRTHLLQLIHYGSMVEGDNETSSSL